MAQANAVLATATSLQDFIDFAAYLAPLEQALTLAIPNKLAEPKPDQTGVGNGTSVKDLNGWWPLIESFPAHVNGEDIFKSMIVIGAAGKKLDVFANKHFATDQGAMEITVGGVSILKDMAIETTVVGSVPMTIGGSSKMTALSKGSYPIVASVTWPQGMHQITRSRRCAGSDRPWPTSSRTTSCRSRRLDATPWRSGSRGSTRPCRCSRRSSGCACTNSTCSDVWIATESEALGTEELVGGLDYGSNRARCAALPIPEAHGPRLKDRRCRGRSASRRPRAPFPLVSSAKMCKLAAKGAADRCRMRDGRAAIFEGDERPRGEPAPRPAHQACPLIVAALAVVVEAAAPRHGVQARAAPHITRSCSRRSSD